MRTSTRSNMRTASPLRMLRTAFSPIAAPVSSYTVMQESSSSSPLSATSQSSPARSSSSGRLSHFSNFSSISLNFRNVRNIIRRSPSNVELEQEEERQILCADELLGLVEPRPMATGYVEGFEEVMFRSF